MAARIAAHRNDRPPHWKTVEAPLEIADAIARCGRENDFLLLDCLTLWLGNLCWEHRDGPEREIEAAALRELARIESAVTGGHLVLVTNEIGGGLVPENPLGRFFRDLQGRVNQHAARLAGQVFLMVAGIPVAIKGQERSR